MNELACRWNSRLSLDTQIKKRVIQEKLKMESIESGWVKGNKVRTNWKQDKTRSSQKERLERQSNGGLVIRCSEKNTRCTLDNRCREQQRWAKRPINGPKVGYRAASGDLYRWFGVEFVERWNGKKDSVRWTCWIDHHGAHAGVGQTRHHNSI